MHTDISVPGRRRFLTGLAATLILTGCSHPRRAAADPRVSYYTCAMHPSVRSDNPKGKCPICGMDLVPVYKDTAKEEGRPRTLSLDPEQARLLGIVSAPVAFREAVRTLHAPGKSVSGGVAASFFEGDAVFLSRGQEAQVAFDNAPSPLSGKIASVGAADPASHRREVRIVLARSVSQSGQACAVTVPIPLGKKLVAPLAAVLPTGTRHVVLVDLGEGTYEPRYITVGEALPDGWEIVSGVREGEKLVVSANYLVEAQARIEGLLNGWGEAR